MKKLLIAVAAVVLILLGLELEVTGMILEKLKNAFYPVFVGVLTAIFLNAPISLLEKTLLGSPKLNKVRRALSLTITLIVIAGAAAGLIALTVPDIKAGIASLQDTLRSFDPAKYGKIVEFLADRGKAWFENSLPDAAAAVAGKAGREVVSIVIGIALGVMAVASKEHITGFLKKIAKHFWGEERAAFVTGATAAAVDKFSSFMAGQALEAVIFGAACYVVFLIFGIPYPLILALISAVTNLIPTLGGYVGAAAGAVLVLAAAPQKIWLFLIIVLVLQQLEQMTTYPVIVGRYVGLKGVYVFLAVIVGGGLFGFWGLVLGVPVAAFAYNLIGVTVQLKADKKGKPNPEKSIKN